MKWLFPYFFYLAEKLRRSVKSHKKAYLSVFCSLLVVVLVVAIVAIKPNKKRKDDKSKASSVKLKASSAESVVSEASSAESVVSKAEETPAPPALSGPQFKYNTNLVPDDNVFLDALEFTGYNLKKHRSDGLMWTYILSTDKAHRGWLSKITYGGGCSGYEKDANGMPNIARFEQGGLVCASYATYVYFNYLPNVARIDTSALDRPEKSWDANCWYLAGKKWVEKGYSRYIEWSAKPNGTRTIFNAAEDIPIGSLMLMQDFNNRNGHCTHICLYAGYKNGNHWVTHVGNANGPEFCAMERMSCGPDPQWPLAVITTPKNLGLFDVTEN